MKIYGFDDTGPHRGELLAATMPARDLDFGLEAIACDLGWAQAFTTFGEARRALLEEMREVSADRELVNAVRACKASYVPIVDEED